VRRYATVAVVGTTVAKNLFPDGEDPLGRSVIVNNILFRIIGVMEPKGATARGDDQDDVIFLPVTTGGLRLFGETYVRSVTVAVSDVARITDTQSAINALVKDRHGKEDFQIRNMAALMETISATANTLAVLLGSIAAISLIVGGIGVMNIMLMSVTERTREIGIRMATGATTRNILQQFMTEAVVVSGVGGVLGVVLGFAGGLAVALAGLPLAFTAWPVLLAFACAVLTGLLFGLMPAMKAARLDPVVALASD
jgi:macrolide transport system ATP-binding/permease protein